MTEVAEEFVLLAEGLPKDEPQRLLTRPLDVVTSDGPLRLAIDGSGYKHLLIPIGDASILADTRSRGVVLVERELVVEGVTRRFADLHCREAALGLVFERLVEDVLRRLEGQGLSPEEACHATLEEWRALLRSAGDGTSRESVIGLTGELEVLRRLGQASPTEALTAWRGPSRSVHDFVRGGTAIEVKATSAVSGAFVTISNLDQLDFTGLDALHLVVVHVKQDDRAESLDDRVRALIAMGFPKADLIAAVAAGGHVFESSPAMLPTFQVRSLRVWRVADGCPGLSRRTLSEAQLRGVTNLKYELTLDALPPRLRDSDATAFFEGWLADE